MRSKKKCSWFCYLVERRTDKKRFCAFGNFKDFANHPCVLYEFLPKGYLGYSCQDTPFGLARNISSDLRCDGEDARKYRVIRQQKILSPIEKNEVSKIVNEAKCRETAKGSYHTRYESFFVENFYILSYLNI